jgi:hypothetical protein
MGDWYVRGPDYDTALISEVTDSHIDAARLARIEHQSGFPSWGLYRTVCAGDDLHLRKLKDWVIAFACVFGMTGGVKRAAYSDELAYAAGLDALHILIHNREMQPHTTTAADVGVHHVTYHRFRQRILNRLAWDLFCYSAVLGIAFRQVLFTERKCETRKTGATLELKGSRFAPDAPGCYYTAPAPDSDSL